ncbi:uncharacterized protein LOC129777015 [Toxorhynchites rutilus septentrionalis]|uniref:uncharacterized protein LOC129777015 n=1 Tax=Toxorhynchites rutilus septentrionalis TaxID=329112 RepID=UPI00247A7E5F|nr:uncharacterized protein LOC129777015 [Toxorhynchites rutilus septentrionalis]XP_055639021.1 uncharacterized protein LOC129777015 [Toxorhynchites rutilus septentrionalis]XP_055639022.1 uncharacterized protein LOC129777015 [Toxorhynchites rutilus septentrionalis]XP_055639023.1 uncharacterized protein LOC129777015 [Toxorhynchites rutilus septentrionalis]XP_055639024.1 uncharacterized protein LOC129777015 [Toxorhynchites rutilus septentrionalis]
MEFLKAVQNGLYETVRASLSKIDIDQQDESTANSALHLAVTSTRNKTKLIELLIGAGADCDLKNRDGLTPSELALSKGARNVAEFMVRKEFEGVPDDRAVYRLVRRGCVELLRIYLEKRAFDIHTKMKLIVRAVDELGVKRVTLEEQMKVFLEYQLVDYSYRFGAVGGMCGARRKADQGEDDQEAEKRVEMILNCTKYLRENYDGDDLNDLDDKFVLRLRIICECCFFLEDIEARRERKLYTHIPLSEITYLIGVFLAILERHVGFEIYKLVINKNMIMSYLGAVCDELRVETVGGPRRGKDNSFQWTAQLLLDLIGCIREERLLRYIARRKRVNEALNRIGEAGGGGGEGVELSPVDREVVMNELQRKEFQTSQEGVLERDGKWYVAEFVSYLKCERKTIAALWHQRHPKLRLQKRQVQFIVSRKVLSRIKSHNVGELSKNKMKIVEKEVNSHEFQALTKTISRRSRLIFRRMRKTFDQIKQMYTVKKIAHYIENVIVIDADDEANESLCMLAIKRVLQLIDQSIRNDHQHPAFVKVLENVLDHVLSSTQSSHKSKDFREFFSQRYSLAKYLINKSLDLSHFKLMQDSLRSVYRFFLYVINIQLIEAYKTFLGIAYRLSNLAQIKSFAKYVGDHNLHTLSHIQFDHVFYNEDDTASIIYELKKMYTGMSNELKLLSFIEKNIHFRFYHMQYHQTRLRVTLSSFSVVYRALRANPCFDSVRRLLYSYLHQSYQKYDISKSISISDSTLALKELLRPYGSVHENEETLAVVKHLEQLQELMDPDRLFGIAPVRSGGAARGVADATRYHQFTRKLLEEVGVQLGEEDFGLLHDRLGRAYYGNIFVLQNRHRVLGEFFRQRDIRVDGKRLAGCREHDEEQLQEEFDAKVNDLVRLLERFGCLSVEGLMGSLSELPPFVQIALEFGLLELLEILVAVNALGSNFQALKGRAPVLSGRNLKSYLERDSLVMDLLVFGSMATVYLNALIFKEYGFKLYGGGGSQVPEVPVEIVGLEDKFRERWKWFEMQEILYDSVRMGDLDLVRENVSNGSDLRGKRFGPLVLKELCQYSLIDCAIAGNFKDMIDMLNRDYSEISAERVRLLKYLLRRTVKSHFLVGQYCKLSPEDRKMLVLYLCAFLGDVGLFLRNLERYNAYEDLHLFVNSENHDFVSQVIRCSSGYDFNKCDSNGMTILHKLVNSGNLQAVESLSRIADVDFNATNSLKYSALNLACRLNLLEIVKFLVGFKSIDKNTISEDEKLPVFWLIQYQNSREIIHLAVDPTTELTSFSSELCLLHKAIEFDNLDVVRYLIEDRKVEPARIYSNCNNVLHAAASYNRIHILNYLLSLPNIRKLINNTNLVKNTPLNIACKEGYLTVAKTLLQHNVRTDTCGEYGLNPLAFAMYTNSFKLMKLLFQHGAKISYPLSSDFQPINMAILNRNIPMLKFLLKSGVDANSAPLCFINAVYSGSREIVRILFSAKATYVNYKDEFCQTALHLCVERDEYEIARELLKCGADINAKNRSGTTPLHLAVQGANVRFVQLLLDHRCLVDELNYHGETPLIKAVVCNNLEIMKLLLNNGASVERLRNSDPPVLLYLVQENHEEILDYLLEHCHFNPNEQDAQGNSLLYIATQHNHVDLVKLLVDKYHAKANPVNHKKLTPLMLARVKEHTEIFSFLESRVAEE